MYIKVVRPNWYFEFPVNSKCPSSPLQNAPLMPPVAPPRPSDGVKWPTGQVALIDRFNTMTVHTTNSLIDYGMYLIGIDPYKAAFSFSMISEIIEK